MSKYEIIRLIFFCTLIYISSSAQSNNTYQNLIPQTGLFHLQKNPEKAVQLYEKAFEIQKPDALTAYKVVGIYSLNQDSEKAFKYLKTSLSSSWTEADWLLFDPYFDYLRTNNAEKWKDIFESKETSEPLIYKYMLIRFFWFIHCSSSRF